MPRPPRRPCLFHNPASGTPSVVIPHVGSYWTAQAHLPHWRSLPCFQTQPIACAHFVRVHASTVCSQVKPYHLCCTWRYYIVLHHIWNDGSTGLRLMFWSGRLVLCLSNRYIHKRARSGFWSPQLAARFREEAYSKHRITMPPAAPRTITLLNNAHSEKVPPYRHDSQSSRDPSAPALPSLFRAAPPSACVPVVGASGQNIRCIRL